MVAVAAVYMGGAGRGAPAASEQSRGKLGREVERLSAMAARLDHRGRRPQRIGREHLPAAGEAHEMTR